MALNLIRLSKKGRQSPYFTVPPLEEGMKQEQKRNLQYSSTLSWWKQVTCERGESCVYSS